MTFSVLLFCPIGRFGCSFTVREVTYKEPFAWQRTLTARHGLCRRDEILDERMGHLIPLVYNR